MKNYLKIIPLLAALILLLLFPEPVIRATYTGVLAWADKVVPALFPFLVLTSLMAYYQVPQIIGKVLTPLFGNILHISPITFFIMLMSFVSGNPSGARMAREYFEKGDLSKKEFRGLLYYCNFASPLFIIGTTGILLYDSPRVGYLLLFAHLMGSLAVFICCYPALKTIGRPKAQAITFPDRPFAELLLDSIETATATLVKVGGIITFFYIMTEIINLIQIYRFINVFFAPLLALLQVDNAGPILSGMIEFTQGVFKISDYGFSFPQQLAFTAFIISFAGLSVHTQVYMFAKGSGFKYPAYLLYRTLHGWASALIVLFGWHFFLTDVADVFLPAEPEILRRSFCFLPFTLAIIGFYFFLRVMQYLPKLYRLRLLHDKN